jgi:ribosomal protein S18 acetylase RimI-like enzyme
VKVRDAIATDARGVAEVHVRSWQHAYRGLLPDAVLDELSVDAREAMWSRVVASSAGSLLVAEEAGAVTGFAAFGRWRDAAVSPTDHELWAIYVEPTHWRAGVGRLLWLCAHERMAAAGATSVTVWVLAANQRARSFYEALGFQLAPEHGSRVIEVGAAEVDEVRYVLAVG